MDVILVILTEGTMKPSAKDPRRDRVTKICLALPEVTCENQGTHARFVIAKKTLAYYVNDHHGNGIIAVWCKVLPGDNTVLAASDPKKFYIPEYVGPKGWVGLRLDTGEVDWEEAGDLIAGSYRLIAPKRLVKALST